MSSAKITRCHHFFHGVCLRKWLYVQDRCPMCHEIIMHHEPVQNEKQGAQQIDREQSPPVTPVNAQQVVAEANANIAQTNNNNVSYMFLQFLCVIPNILSLVSLLFH